MSLSMISPYFGDNLLCDPYWNQVELLMHCDGTDGSTVLVDSSVNGFTLTSNGAVVDDAQSKFGGTSCYFNGTGTNTAGNTVITPTNSVFTFGFQDFTVEKWVRLAQTPAVTAVLIDGRPAGINGAYFDLVVNASRQLELYVNSATQITSTAALNLDQWYHIAVSRNNGTTRLFIDGLQSGSSWTDTTDYLQNYFKIGASGYHTGPSSQYGLNGWLDDLRITVGVGRYPSSFTVPTVASYEVQCNWFFGGSDIYLASGMNDNDVVADGRALDGLFQYEKNPVGTASTLSTDTVFGYRSRAGQSTSFSRWDTAPIADSYWTNAAGWTIDCWLNIYASQGGTVWLVRDTPTVTGYNGPRQILHMLQVISGGTDKVLRYSQSLDSTYDPTSGLGSWAHIVGTIVIPTSKWVHVRVACRNGVIQMYQNGVADGSSIAFNNTTPGARNKFMLFSKDGAAGTGEPFSGGIDSFCMFSRAFRMELTGVPTQEYDGLNRYNMWLGQKNGITSQGDSKVTQTTGSLALSARARAMLPISGKWYWEMEVGVNSGTFLLGAGLANTDDIELRALARSSGVSMLTLPGATAGTLTTFTAGRLMFAFDADTRKLWMGQGGTWFSSGNPATDANPYIYNIPRVQLYPAIHGDNNGAIHHARFCATSATCSYSPPSGYYHLCENASDIPADASFSSVVLLLAGQGANNGTVIVDSSSLENAATITGNTKTVTTLKKWGNSSIYFDGSGDYIRYASGSTFALPGDFTVEAWVYQDGVPGEDYCLFDNRIGGEGYGMYTCVNGYEDKLVLTNNAAIVATSSSAIPGQAWTHVAFTKSGTTVKGYIDGVEVLSYVDSRTLASSGITPTIGASNSGGQGFKGHLNDFRITKGVCRYTGAFTPPTRPFSTR